MEKQDWQSLEKLRALFLDEKDHVRRKDYWESEEVLSLYDKTFAQRIGWKWQAVLNELSQKINTDSLPKQVHILDWGCGTGIASRTLLSHFGEHFIESEVHLHDRSSKASRFALQRLREEFPRTKAQIAHKKSFDEKETCKILLLSHVLNEIEDSSLSEIKQLIAKSDFTFWVEAGTFEISRKLLSIREDVRRTQNILAPCPQTGPCPMLQDKNAKHWCHNFAEAPAEVFHSGFWRQFSRTLKIDLRSLATSFLILSKHPVPMQKRGDRILGRSKKLKSHVELITCTEREEIKELAFTKRNDLELYKQYSETEFYTILEGL
jgi:ribosomal protein RSM22 (predicted rRNA methylase)